MTRIVVARLALMLACGLVATSARAQLGSGWVQYSPTKRIHLDDEAGLQTFTWTSSKSVCSNTACADYSYDSATDTETFRIFDSRSNRSEIRLQNEYATGRRQFEGYVTFYAPLENESLMQIFGSTTGATLTMTRGYASSGGHITCTSTGGGVTFGSTTIATACYGVELRINIIHDQDNYIRWYVNGILKCEQRDTEVGVDNYHKYGCYGTTSGNVPAIVKWRAVKSFKDGFPPGHTVSPVPAVFTLNPGSSVTSRVDVSSFTGNVTLSISNLPAGAAATFNPATIPGGVGSSTLTVTTLNNLAPGNYPLAIKGTDSSTNITATLNLGVIPVGWTGKDIGGPGEAGWASFSAGVFTLNGGGNDIWSSADKFNYAFKPLPGDTTITARVDLQEHTNPWAKAGVMFRDSTNASARYVGLYVTPSNGVSMQFRSATGSNAVDHARHTGISAPHWVRLARNGNSFSGFRSSDGANWIQVGSTSFAMSNTALVGLALTSHDDAVLNTSTFSSVSAPAPRPRFTSIVQYASSLALAGTNGVAGQTYYTLVTTNLASPVVNWMRVATNQFGPNGSFAFTNAFNAASPHLYLLQMP